ncbi:PREDICTED: X-linked retinitis pigmentosa GTPase regulator isoform X2 [Vollenhovia emeryi]|uniref:X-linked retinitis pigmentosa GTPase regulator isoform X2 n=1 Tax=Vollenhovia emeryi TaxID=411798 RepID=UPI0005F4FAE9|nr:PREDICTED: X-linked retinitis pigmentosa GTPase regulator isoform X2 [Vollenhovia emeryi]
MGLPDIETIPETGAVFTIGRSRFADNIASHFFIRKDPVVIIECGDEHSAVVCQTGRLFVFGSNDWGQLGLGHKNHISKPSCVKRAQKVFACGSNQEGQLGRENSAIGDSSSSPILIYDCGLAGPRIVQVAAGSHHSMVLTSDGGVVAWGSNLEGQLGLPGISGLVTKPTKVPIPEPVKEISTGYYHSVFLTESGLVYVCGESESGKLGINVNFSTQVAPKQMQLPAPALHVACGGHHTLILAENGSVYCSGSNASGQLGMGINVNEIHTPKLLPRGALQDEKIVKISCGESHSAILTESGKLFTCGDGRHGKLGLEENENNVHEVTFAAKYQELFVSNVACGGCHTILVGRRHEIDYQSQRQPDSMEQRKSSLPPLKLPINMQNEHRVDNTGKSTDEKDDSHHPDKNNETSDNNDAQANSADDSSKENVNNEEISSSANDEKIASPSPKNTPENSQVKDLDDEGHDNEHIESSESKDINENDENQENNKNTEMAATVTQDVEESCTKIEISRIEEEDKEEPMTNPTPPPKPPRLKSGSAESPSNEKESLKENEEDEKEKDDKEMETNNEQALSARAARKSVSAISKETIEAIENSIEKVDEDGERVEEPEKAEIDSTQDDADVVQSPPPRTAKMAKLFKGKRQQEVQNGTKKSSSTANPKAKSKTCTIL